MDSSIPLSPLANIEQHGPATILSHGDQIAATLDKNPGFWSFDSHSPCSFYEKLRTEPSFSHNEAKKLPPWHHGVEKPHGYETRNESCNNGSRAKAFSKPMRASRAIHGPFA
jgi:hypothetical protein